MLKERLITPKGSPFSGTKQPAGDFLVGSLRAGRKPPFRCGEVADYAGQGNVK